MRIEMTERRERKYDQLLDATGENAKSKALDRAASYYIRMAGHPNAHPKGLVEDLLTRAEEQGGLTAAEIAEILDAKELPVVYRTEVETGPTDE